MSATRRLSVLLMAVGLLVCGAFIGRASAAPTPAALQGWDEASRSYAPPAPTTLQEWGDATAQWLAVTLHADVESRSIVSTPNLENAAWAAAYYPDRGEIEMRSDLVAELLSPRRRYETWASGVFIAGHYLRHEYLHRKEALTCNRHDEEGIVDLLARRLDAAWTWRFLGQRAWLGGIVTYPINTANVRAAILKANGDNRWEREDELLLRRLWGGSCEFRDETFARVAAML